MFTEEQLNLIKEAARKTKNQGEVAVFYRAMALETEHILKNQEPIFFTQQRRIIEYCAHECKNQRSGEMSVYNMVNAWDWACQRKLEESTLADIELDRSVNLRWIAHLGALVEPDVNRNGFRTIQVGVNTNTGFKEFIPWTNIERSLTYLLESYYDETLYGTDQIHDLSRSAEDEFYYHYENIHPFRDGNGRSGKIVYNYLKGTLDSPVVPPNFFESEGGIP